MGRRRSIHLPECHRHLRQAYRLMLARNGHQSWWPAESRFEVCVGAILTQNTSWTNVERALNNLKAAQLLHPRRLAAVTPEELAQHLRPAGYFNVKTRRLRAFLKCLEQEYGGDLDALFAGPTPDVRIRLLAVHGIGPETADSLLLYAGDHPSFVVDAYTRRIFSRHGWCLDSASYDEIKTLCETSLSERIGARRLDYWQDYHAQLVAIGKEHCRPSNPRCHDCPLQPLL